MIIFIVAGGSGTRLWPLSTPDYPKHLLRLNGSKSSLLQDTFERAKLITDNIYVITEKSHYREVQHQLKKLPNSKIIVEPLRRGTANCITLALSKIADKVDPDESIAFIHADHLIRDKNAFKLNFNKAFDVVSRYKKLTLIGISPTYPSTGFGYIHKGELLDKDLSLYKVESFKEKPHIDIAKKYYSSGEYLWNSGYFIGTLNIFINSLKSFSPSQYEIFEILRKVKNEKTLLSEYKKLENLAIDNVLIEKMKNLIVMPSEFDWADLGSFGDLSDLSPKDNQGNTLYGDIYLEKTRSSYLYNDTNKPVMIIGLSNVVVINTKNGTLITTKDLAQDVGKIAKKINEDKL